MNCTKDQFVWLLNDIAVNNENTLLKPLAAVLEKYPYLAELNVHGHTAKYSVSALCGNGCTVRSCPPSPPGATRFPHHEHHRRRLTHAFCVCVSQELLNAMDEIVAALFGEHNFDDIALEKEEKKAFAAAVLEETRQHNEEIAGDIAAVKQARDSNKKDAERDHYDAQIAELEGRLVVEEEEEEECVNKTGLLVVVERRSARRALL